MAKSFRVTTKSRGRPKTTGPGTQIGMRWEDHELEVIDTWRREQPDLPSRPEAIRRLVASALAEPQKKRIPSGELVWLRRSFEPGGYRHIVKRFDEQFAAMQSLKGMLMIADRTNPHKHRIYVSVPEASRQSYPHFRRVRTSDVPADAEFLAGDEAEFTSRPRRPFRPS